MSPIPNNDTTLVQKFVDAFHGIQERVDEKDNEGAADGYKKLLTIYNEIASSNLDPLHKELAYDQLTKVYQSLQNQPQGTIHTTTHIIAAAVLLVLFSFLVFFKPAIFSFAIAEQTTTQKINWAFVESGSREVHLYAIPSSLKISGKVDGDGFVRVYAVTPTSRVLLFDNDITKTNNNGAFSKACVNTCTTGIDNKDFRIEVVLENAALTIYSLEYTTEPQSQSGMTTAVPEI